MSTAEAVPVPSPPPADHAWVLIGGGGHAASIAAAIARCGGTVTAVVDPSPRRSWPCPVYQSEEAVIAGGHERPALVGVGSNEARLRALVASEAAGLTIGTLVAATATVDAVAIGRGVVVLEHAHVGAGARLAEAVVVNTGAVVEHDCVVGPGVHVAPGARVLGECVIEDGALVGAGAVVLPGVRVGRGAQVGAGAVVTDDLPPGVVARGVPARVRG